jgi:hypothetical protein
MNRDDALTIVLAEAFSESGLAMVAQAGQDPGHRRMENLILAINFLADDLSAEDHLGRMLVSALFTLANRVPEDLERAHSPTSDSRCSLSQQAGDLLVAISHLVENWDHWPDIDDLPTCDFGKLSDERPPVSVADEECEGYRVGDITYCVVPETDEIFPVRVVRLGFNVVEVEPLDPGYCETVCEPFTREEINRCFRPPHLPAAARLGGFDERLVNSERKSGPELRLLPTHYATKTGALIKERHASDPDRWPLPTGLVFERWFKAPESQEP